jgi:hypothetical protein
MADFDWVCGYESTDPNADDDVVITRGSYKVAAEALMEWLEGEPYCFPEVDPGEYRDAVATIAHNLTDEVEHEFSIGEVNYWLMPA